MNTQTDSRDADRAAHTAPSEQAAAWFARLHADDVTAEQQDQFDAWLKANPAHRRAYQQIEAFWRHPDFTGLLAETPLSTVKKPRRRRQTAKALAMAACLLLAVIWNSPNISCLTADYCTGVGEILTVQLADGSQITLNSDTALNVSLQNRLRHIELSRGEAFFAVRRNPEQPFVVDSRFSQTRVLGTRFLVRQNRDADTVTVVSGLVEVKGRRLKPLQLHADQQAAVAGHPGPAVLVGAMSAAAWLKGHALFDNAPLSQVVAELNRYRRGSVLISNDRLKQLKVSGRFTITDTDQALQSLQQTLPIRVYYLTPWLVVIS